MYAEARIAAQGRIPLVNERRSYKLGSILNKLSPPHENAHDAIGAGMLYGVVQLPVN